MFKYLVSQYEWKEKFKEKAAVAIQTPSVSLRMILEQKTFN